MFGLRIWLAVLALVAAAPAVAPAQEWPSRPIRFIVPFPAGGSTDVAARLIGEHLSRSLGQQVVVENKAGANGNIAVEAAAKSTSDGYTVLVATDSVVSNPHVYKTNIDVLKDLVPKGEIVPMLGGLLKQFRDERRGGEGFGDYCQRLGQAEVQRRAGVEASGH